MNGRNWRTLTAALLFGLIAAACAGSTSDANAGAPDTTAEAPAVAEEVEEAPETEAVEETAEPEPAAEEEPVVTEEEPVEEPAEADEAAAPTEESAVEVSPIFEGSFVDLNGEAIDLASYQGQDVVLWFWAPW